MLDTGTPQSMFEASTFINIIETKQGIKIAWLEEIAYKKDGLMIRYAVIY